MNCRILKVFSLLLLFFSAVSCFSMDLSQSELKNRLSKINSGEEILTESTFNGVAESYAKLPKTAQKNLESSWKSAVQKRILGILQSKSFQSRFKALLSGASQSAVLGVSLLALRAVSGDPSVVGPSDLLTAELGKAFLTEAVEGAVGGAVDYFLTLFAGVDKDIKISAVAQFGMAAGGAYYVEDPLFKDVSLGSSLSKGAMSGIMNVLFQILEEKGGIYGLLSQVQWTGVIDIPDRIKAQDSLSREAEKALIRVPSASEKIIISQNQDLINVIIPGLIENIDEKETVKALSKTIISSAEGATIYGLLYALGIAGPDLGLGYYMAIGGLQGVLQYIRYKGLRSAVLPKIGQTFSAMTIIRGFKNLSTIPSGYHIVPSVAYVIASSAVDQAVGKMGGYKNLTNDILKTAKTTKIVPDVKAWYSGWKTTVSSWLGY